MTAVGTAEDFSGPTELDSRVHRDDARLAGFFGGRLPATREGVQARDKSILVPFDTLEMQADQIAHRELPGAATR